MTWASELRNGLIEKILSTLVRCKSQKLPGETRQGEEDIRFTLIVIAIKKPQRSIRSTIKAICLACEISIDLYLVYTRDGHNLFSWLKFVIDRNYILGRKKFLGFVFSKCIKMSAILSVLIGE